MKIPVTRNFDTTDPIGILTLRDDIEIASDMVFALAYTVVEPASQGKLAKIAVQSVSLILDRFYRPYQKQATEEEKIHRHIEALYKSDEL